MHTLIKLVLVVGISAFAAVLIWATGAPPVKAAEPACAYVLPSTLIELTNSNTPHALLNPNGRDHFMAMLESQAGIQYPEVRNVLIAKLEGGVYYGLEIGGCLTRPALLEAVAPKRLSGATPTGVYA